MPKRRYVNHLWCPNCGQVVGFGGQGVRAGRIFVYCSRCREAIRVRESDDLTIKVLGEDYFA